MLVDSDGTANAAARAVKVTYTDVKPPILTPRDALAKKSFFPKAGPDLVVGDAEGSHIPSTFVQGSSF